MSASPVLRALPLLSLLVGCSGGPAAPLVKAPEYAPEGETKCAITRSHSAPLIVEWPSTERAKLESLARGGVVPVSYAGCHMKTLASCRTRAGAKYRYVALTPKHDVLRMRDEGELYANMPIYAASFRGKLERAGGLTVEMTIVGRFESEAAPLSAADLDGDCGEATHVITAITSGAFRFATGASAEVGAGGSAFGVAAGGRSASSREVLAQDGDERSCAASAEGAPAPPFGCGAFLRLEVTPLAKSAAARPAPEATASSPAAPPSAVSPCPKGSHRTEAGCVADVDKTCAAGMHFEDARGCVADATAAGRYQLSGELVVDTKTKLTWHARPDPHGLAWSDAKAFCAGLDVGGRGFRVPTKEELLGLGENLPAGIDRRAFPAVTAHEKTPVEASVVFYWSSTAHPRSDTMAWGVRYAVMGAQAVMQSKSSRHLVRCVK
ncbi:MAG: DUF1566 domain-containing protein [Myxococcales bacterium]|nr:DUF1566 domain-containing protein [Myxococcales bacterium]